jgi:hypothetical protein
MSGRYVVALGGAAVALLGLALAVVDYMTSGRMSSIGATISCIGFIGLAAGLADFYRVAGHTSARFAKSREGANANREMLVEQRRKEEAKLRRTAEEVRQEARSRMEETRVADLLHAEPSTAADVGRYYAEDKTISGCLFVAGGLVALVCGLGALMLLLMSSQTREALPLGIGLGISAFVTGSVLFGLGSVVRLLIEACALLRRLDDRDAAKMRESRRDRA